MNTIELLETHGFNSNIYLFGAANSFYKEWIFLNLKEIGGIVGTLHFSAPQLVGKIAAISQDADSSTTPPSFPDNEFFLSIRKTKEKHHIESIAKTLHQISEHCLEASFIGSRYHMDAKRKNYAIINGNDINRYADTTEATLLKKETYRSPIRRKINEFKYSVTVEGLDGLIISINQEGDILFAHFGENTIDVKNIILDANKISGIDAVGSYVFSIASPYLSDILPTKHNPVSKFICFSGSTINMTEVSITRA